MKYLCNKTSSLNGVGKRLVIAFVLFHAFVLSNIHVQATTTTQYAEMATALAAIPFDMAANHATFKNKNSTKSAVLLHVTAQTLGIFNKILFLHNNITAQKEIHGGQWTSKSRDFLVNSAFLLRGLIKLDQHLRAFAQIPSSDDDFSLGQPESELDGSVIGLEKEQEISKLAYAWQVVALPSLKGLTAFALACTQDDATPYEKYSNQQARNLVTATHALVNLSEEYTQLKPDSAYKKLVAALLFVNTVWLVYELQKYIRELPAPYVPMQKVQGECASCMDGETKELEQLQGCGHTQCKDCFAGWIKAKYNSADRATIDRVSCPHPGCTEHISRGAIAEILDGDDDKDKILKTYDEVVRDRKKKKVLDDQAKDAMRRLGAKPCPACKEAIEKNGGCDHMTCKYCRHQFWWTCGHSYHGMLAPCGGPAGCIHHGRNRNLGNIMNPRPFGGPLIFRF